MIIEGAFLKLPELLLGHMFPMEQYEATLVNHLAMGILLELSARSISLPMHRVHLERPYPKVSKSRFPGRADLYVNLEGVFKGGLRDNLYGMKTHNWIEAKFFGGIGRQAGHQTKSGNAAKIVLDLFRLCLFVREERSKCRDNGRYLVIIFNRNPKDYLAFHRKNSAFPEREWLGLLLQPGDRQIQVTLEHEPYSFKKIFQRAFVEYDPDLDFKLRFITWAFSPTDPLSQNLYWGYLIRVVDFDISFGGDKLIYKDSSQEVWSERQEKMQKQMIERTLEAQIDGAVRGTSIK